MASLVCCVDDSDGSRAALAVGRELADRLDLELVLLHVAPPTEAPGVSAAIGGQQRLREEELRDAEELLARIASDEGLGDVRTRAEVGRAEDRIVAVCKEEAAAFVVLGSRGRGGVRSALLGSVSTAVASHAPCPVVVVPRSAAGA